MIRLKSLFQNLHVRLLINVRNELKQVVCLGIRRRGWIGGQQAQMSNKQKFISIVYIRKKILYFL